MPTTIDPVENQIDFEVVAPCTDMILVDPLPPYTVEYMMGTQLVDVFPQYSGLPVGCKLNLIYEVTLEG